MEEDWVEEKGWKRIGLAAASCRGGRGDIDDSPALLHKLVKKPSAALLEGERMTGYYNLGENKTMNSPWHGSWDFEAGMEASAVSWHKASAVHYESRK